MNRVDGKVAIVTGGGSGIGKASCEILAAAGAEVVVADINIESAEDTVDTIIRSGGKAIAMRHDVTSKAEWKSIIDFTLKRFNYLGVLVNSAGIRSDGAEFEDISAEQWRNVLSVNLDGVFWGTQNAVKVMAKFSKERACSIINISSVMGIVGGGSAPYSASKGGVRSLTKSVAAMCGRKGYNIRVNSIHPGFIRTPMVQVDSDLEEKLISLHPIGRLGEPIDVAKGVLFLASDDSSFVTGSELIIDGGYTAV